MKPTDEKTMDEIASEVYGELARYEFEISAYNDSIIKSLGKRAPENFKALLDYADVTGKIEFVAEPKGENQKEKHGVFCEVWVDQRSVGTEGDSYEGFIYAGLKDNRWIKIPYSC